MKIHGWCTGCKKIKLVTVRIPRVGGVQAGTCDSCEEAKR